MVTTVSNPSKGSVGALVLGLDEFSRSRARLRSILLLTAVGSNPLIAKLAAGIDVENAVDNTVDAEVSHRLATTIAAAQKGASNNGDSAENILSDC